MSKRSLTVKSDALLRESEPGVFEVVEPTKARTPFLSFSYSVTEVSSFAGRTHVKSRTTRLTDGKLVSENFDAEVEGGAYERLAAQATEQFASQLRLMMQPFRWLLPFPRDPDK